MPITESEAYGERSYMHRLSTKFEVGDRVRIGPRYVQGNTYEPDDITGQEVTIAETLGQNEYKFELAGREYYLFACRFIPIGKEPVKLDPNETLIKVRVLANRIADGQSEPDSTDASELAEAFQELDAWMTKGGFIPTSWNRYRQ